MISIVVPMYNASKTIVRCLDSIKNQTYRGSLEIIIVNDGSIDNSRQIVENYVLENQTLDIKLINQENGGVSKARNAGLKIATGEYIAFLDSDDEWLPGKVQTQIKYLADEGRNIDFVCSLRNHERLTFPYSVSNNDYAEINLKRLLFKVVGQTSTALFKRKILANTGYFDESQKYSEDANYWMRISNHNKMIILNKTLVITGGGKPSVGHSGLSSDIEAMEKGVQKNIEEVYGLKRINISEYLFFKCFSKIKYLIRLIKYKKYV